MFQHSFASEGLVSPSFPAFLMRYWESGVFHVVVGLPEIIFSADGIHSGQYTVKNRHSGCFWAVLHYLCFKTVYVVQLRRLYALKWIWDGIESFIFSDFTVVKVS